NTSGQPLGPRVIAWIGELGPTGGAGGGDERTWAYSNLAGGKCDHVLSILDNLDEPSRSVYEGAASACLAAFHNRPQLWPRAQAALTTVGSQTSRLDCLDTPVHELLQSLMEMHRQDPDAQFVTNFDSGEEELSCPHVLELVPDHGPRQGGYSVRLIGENLPPMTGIHFGKKYLTVSTNGGREAVITVPPADEALPPEDEYDGYNNVGVWADGWPPGIWMVPPVFKYDPAERTENAPPASSSPPTS
ncbi:MAG: hypothetical protein LC799_13960, partial [Actinobacteria bacterium]|nr:hypothetical protein [Actinomycetota bacterium]